MNFIEKLKKYRSDNNFTQENLAKALYVSRSSIAKWEQGRGFPSLDILSRLAQLMDTTLDDLVSEKEIKTITLKNSDKLKRNSFAIKIIVVVVVLAVIFSCVVLAITLKVRHEEDQIIGESIFVKIINTENGFAAMASDNSMINFDNADISHVKVFNRHGKQIAYKDLKVGYYVMLTYFDKNLPKKTTTNLTTIEIIEDYVDDYEIYGFLISTTDGAIDPVPINLSTLSIDYNASINIGGEEYHSSFKYPYYIYFDTGSHSKYGGSDLITTQTEFGFQTINDSNGNEYERMLSRDIRCSVTVDKAAFESIWVYVIDNSEIGYYLHGKFTFNSCPSINGHIIKEKIKNENNFYEPYSIEVTYHIFFEIVDSHTITVYEYDKNHTLIKEQIFNSYEDYMNINFMPNKYTVSKNTLYVIVKDESENKSSSYLLGLGESTKFTLSNYFGYVFKINLEISS